MKSHTKETFRIYFQYIKKYGWLFSVIVLSIFLGDIFATATPYIYKLLIDSLVANAGMDRYVQLLLWILGIGLCHWFFIRFAEFLHTRFSTSSLKTIRDESFEYLQKHSYQFFQDHFVGSLVKRVNRFARAFDALSSKFIWDVFPIAINVTFVTLVLGFRHWSLAVIILIWVFIYCLANYLFSLYKLKYDVKRAALDTKVTGHLADTITNNNTIRLFASLNREWVAFRDLTEKFRRANVTSWDLGNLFGTLQWLFMLFLELLLVYAAIQLYEQGTLTIGDFILIQSYLIVLFQKLWSFGRMIREAYEHLADAEEMTEILIEPHAVKDSKSAKDLVISHGDVSFIDVDFHYHKTRSILKKFNLELEAGKKTALVGHSGSGKSTIIKLLFRLYDVSNGKIVIDGQKIHAVTQESLRAQISLVPQDPILFHRSLKENIRYARPDASNEELIAAAKAAYCHDFIMDFPDGYDTLVGERGVKLSGGERQRIAIARAILKDAPILVLDEATSSLDSESEKLIQDALETLMKGKTVLTIAHRLSTIMNMDNIVVLEQGNIVEQGSHKQLLRKKNGVYSKLWGHQVGGFLGE